MTPAGLGEFIATEIVAQGNEIDGLGDAESVVLCGNLPTINIAELAEKICAKFEPLKIELAAALEILEQINSPAIEIFAEAVVNEAKHQRLRYGDDHDAGKDAWNWYWLLGYLISKAARADNDGDIAKALHHTITAAAALANWHRLLLDRRGAVVGQ